MCQTKLSLINKQTSNEMYINNFTDHCYSNVAWLCGPFLGKISLSFTGKKIYKDAVDDFLWVLPFCFLVGYTAVETMLNNTNTQYNKKYVTK